MFTTVDNMLSVDSTFTVENIFTVESMLTVDNMFTEENMLTVKNIFTVVFGGENIFIFLKVIMTIFWKSFTWLRSLGDPWFSRPNF